MKHFEKYKNYYFLSLITVFLVLLIVVSIMGVIYTTRDIGNIQGQAIKSYILRNEQGEQVNIEDNVLRIGVITPLSGDYFFIGQETQTRFFLA